MSKISSKIIFISVSGIILFILALVVANVFGLNIANRLTERSMNQDIENLPPATDYKDIVVETNEGLSVFEDDFDDLIVTEEDSSDDLIEIKDTTPLVAALPETVNLNVPFTSQAPSGDWSLTFKEACEESSILMADKFYQSQSFSGASATEDEIVKMVNYEEQTLGFGVDINARQTAELIKSYSGYKNVRVVYDITVDDIKKELAQSKPVIIPAAGRMFGNPYYTPPGPNYHMLVVKGYTKTKFITNDPGTRRGKDFSYSFDTFYNAIHDFDGSDMTKGRKAMIVIDPA